MIADSKVFQERLMKKLLNSIHERVRQRAFIHSSTDVLAVRHLRGGGLRLYQAMAQRAAHERKNVRGR